jgi:N-acetylmuramoyl-L-alanine amidase
MPLAIEFMVTLGRTRHLFHGGLLTVLRLAVVLTWVLIALDGQCATQSPSSVFRALKHVDLRRWAQTHKFEYVQKKEEILLTNRWARLAFATDSRRAEINGVAVYLSYNLLVKNGSVQIAERDLESSIEPILKPVKNRKKPTKVIAISAGHGGKDPGNIAGTHFEKTYTLLLAKELEEVLKQAGFKVVQIRRDDHFVPIEDQPRLAQAKGADTFICLHYNASEVEPASVKGLEVYCLTPAGAISTNGGELTNKSYPGNTWDRHNILLAYEVQKSLVNNFGMTDRGVRHARFVVLKDIQMPAILIEGGFMSNPEDARKIFDARHRSEMAQAIVDGLLAYKRTVQR